MNESSELKGAFEELDKKTVKPKSGKKGTQETYYLPYEIIDVVRVMAKEEKFSRRDDSVSKGTIITEAVKLLAKKLKYPIK